MAAWTKADLARMQRVLDFVHYDVMRRSSMLNYVHNIAVLRRNAHLLVRVNLRHTAADMYEGREQRAYLRIADRLESEPLPSEVVLPGEPDVAPEIIDASEPADWRSEPTPLHDYPLYARIDDEIAGPYYAAVQDGRFVCVREWLLCDGTEAPREHWHDWAHATAERMGAARGWATVREGVSADHPARHHVERILATAAEHVDAPAGIVALDLRGLEYGCARAVAAGLVARARARLAAGEHVRGSVLLLDEGTNVRVSRTVDLYLT